MAGRYLRARRKEGFISVIAAFSLMGIALGVATLIIVMAVMNGFRAELLDRILGINAHVTAMRYGQPIPEFDDIAKKIAAIPHVTQAAPVVDGQAMANANGVSVGAVVKGITLESLQARRLIAGKLVRGDIRQFNDEANVLIGSRMAQSMGLDVGQTITLIAPKTNDTILGAIPKIKEYTIAGIFEVGMFEYDSSYVFMRLPDAQLFFQLPGAVNMIEILTDDPNRVGEISRDVLKVTNHAVNVTDWKRVNSHFFNSLQVERNVMFLILTLIILVAAFNIISSMIMLVNDKTRAIAILRTIGATRGSIMRIFFMCGAAIGVMGTMLGFALGVSFAANIETIRRWLEDLSGTELFSAEIYFLSKLPADVQTDDVISVVGMALLLSFLATIYPAWRAAKISPSEGVRYE